MDTQNKELKQILGSLHGTPWEHKIQVAPFEGRLPTGFKTETGIVVGTDLHPREVVDIAANHGVRHVVQVGSPEAETELKTSALMLADPEKFLDHPASAIFCPESVSDAKDREYLGIGIDFKAANEKFGILALIQSHLSQFIRRQSFITELLLITDELFTNAVFNAPYGHEKNSSGATTNNAKKHGLGGRIFVASDGKRVAIGCCDPYGSLNVADILHRLQRCYTEGPDKCMNMGPGGAGIGSYMIYRSSGSYFGAVKQGYKSFVGSVVPITTSLRQRMQTPKNIHWLSI
ncbi:MAG: hypothetical protein H6626_02010 [Pseudobdellovibrionaceae bacterium]|nr:hypothetical protein [Bdellovibrionales bacterium]USN47888.1 MAG: hypothetical protein H6626_02010 [Pseudobdellovibrionaceae bacterium]